MTDSSCPQLDDNDIRLLASLAEALVAQPRATLQELAQAVGISKASLYRFCRTRDQLVEWLVLYSTRTISAMLDTAGLESEPPLDVLKNLVDQHLSHRELSTFLEYYWREGDPELERQRKQWQSLMDAFFLRGQREGVFRIDISAAALSELWIATMVGLSAAERRGRVARVGLSDIIKSAFLHGTLARPNSDSK